MSIFDKVNHLVEHFRELGIIDNNNCKVSYYQDNNGDVDLMLLFINHNPGIAPFQYAFQKEFGNKFIFLCLDDYVCFRFFK